MFNEKRNTSFTVKICLLSLIFFSLGWTFGESSNNKSFRIWWISETKLFIVISTLRSWSLILSPQIRQSRARFWTWISVRLIKLFWPWKEKRQRHVLMRKKVIPRLCHVCAEPGSGTRTCFGPRNLKIVYLNSRLSTIPPSHSLMRRFRGCQLSRHIKLPNIYEGVIDASVNTCCKLKLVFLEKRL